MHGGVCVGEGVQSAGVQVREVVVVEVEVAEVAEGVEGCGTDRLNSVVAQV